MSTPYNIIYTFSSTLPCPPHLSRFTRNAYRATRGSPNYTGIITTQTTRTAKEARDQWAPRNPPKTHPRHRYRRRFQPLYRWRRWFTAAQTSVARQRTAAHHRRLETPPHPNPFIRRPHLYTSPNLVVIPIWKQRPASRLTRIYCNLAVYAFALLRLLNIRPAE